jgi:hypothetical protein
MNPRQLTRAGCRALLPALLCVWAAGAANAQPLAPTAVQPPARVDVGLRGTVIATAQVKSHTECLSQYQRAGGCTGWNSAGPRGAAERGGRSRLGAAPVHAIGRVIDAIAAIQSRSSNTNTPRRPVVPEVPSTT